MGDAEPALAFVCAYTEGDSDDGGFVSYEQTPENGTLSQQTRTSAECAMFLAIHPEKNYLYTVQQASGGVISAYRYDESTGALTQINTQSTGSEGPCYISLDQKGEYAFVANYHGGTVAMLPIRDDGSVGEATDVVDHGTANDEQDPHPHSIGTGPRNEYAYAPDLGLDEVRIYEIDYENGTLRPAETPSIKLNEGSGPRHFEFHPNGQHVYVINELDSTITTLDYAPESGSLEELETMSTLPGGFDDDSYCADVHVHPTGRWVYGSNRGHDSITIFEVDEATGRLSIVDHESTRGHWPRNFAIDPTGRYLHVENRRDDSIVSFEIDEETGLLTPTGQEFELPEPICMKFDT